MPKLAVILEGNILGVVTSLDVVESYFHKWGVDPTPCHDHLWPQHHHCRWRWDARNGICNLYGPLDPEQLDKIITHLNKKWNIPYDHPSLNKE